jgi:hypothetical protein
LSPGFPDQPRQNIKILPQKKEERKEGKEGGRKGGRKEGLENWLKMGRHRGQIAEGDWVSERLKEFNREN